MRQTYEKLVRDGIPARLDASGVRYEARSSSPDELPGLLLAKLQEEVAELVVAGSDADALDEMADILEVLAAVASTRGSSQAEVLIRQAARREARGSFDRGIVLCWTETP